MPSQSQIQQEVTHRIIDGIGNVPWRKPWQNDPNCGAPTNVVPTALLRDQPAASRSGSHEPWLPVEILWGTYQQWSSLGAQVRRRPADVEPGKWGTNIVLWKQIQKKSAQDDGTKPETFPFLRYFTVFNIDQVEGNSVDHLRACVEEAPEPARASISSQPNTWLRRLEPTSSAAATKPTTCGLSGNSPTTPAAITSGCRPSSNSPKNTSIGLSCCTRSATGVRFDWAGPTVMQWASWSPRLGAFLCAQIGIPNGNDFSNHSAYVECWLNEFAGDNRSHHASGVPSLQGRRIHPQFQSPARRR